MPGIDYEKLGVFYLGRYRDPAQNKTLPDPVLYNSSDLLTHALCVGMTGSGKTGLCVDLIEEAAIDGIPTIVIDPKGDLSNLLLTFPDLRPEDFQPWVNPDDARKKGVPIEAFAAAEADLWRKGLAAWDQDPSRIQRLRDSAEFTIYTPGSNAGVPVSILNSFAAPGRELCDNQELLRERINATVGSLLGLIGLDADPTRSREAIFLANLFQTAWQAGRDLELGSLVQEIQSPPFNRIGVMDVESFYPAKDRFAMATAINGLLAAPGFSSWLEGEPLDIQRIYYTPAGKPRVAIFSISHLSDAERMFFVTLLLNQVLGWMRSQSGTTSLRALVYMDEIFGYFPPVANPPSKLPLLTLLKQARAFGVGVVLATQNPVDLDYKGLSNIGTWFLGRLQTDRDKQRVLDGLEGAASTQGTAMNRAALEQILAGLGNRVFLLHNVHEDAPALFESRWALSYLRGPMSRDQVRLLTSGAPATQSDPPRRSSAPAPARISGGPRADSPAAAAPRVSQPARLVSVRPALPPAIPQIFLPSGATGGGQTYSPMLLGAAQVRFADTKAKADVTHTISLLTPIKDEIVPVDWAEAGDLEIALEEVEKNPAPGIDYALLPAAASQPANYNRWARELVSVIQSSRKLQLFKSPKFGQISEIGESEGDFRVRLQLAARERRDQVAAALRAKYAPKLTALNERIRRAEQAIEREAEQARAAKLSTVVSVASTLLGAFLGRKTLSASTVNRAGTSIRGATRAIEQSQDVARAGETAEALKQQLADLEARFQEELAQAQSAYDPTLEVFQSLELKPKKGDVLVKLVALAWVP